MDQWRCGCTGECSSSQKIVKVLGTKVSWSWVLTFKWLRGKKSTHTQPHMNRGRKQTRPKVNNPQTQENGTHLSTVLVFNFSVCLQVFKIKSLGGRNITPNLWKPPKRVREHPWKPSGHTHPCARRGRSAGSLPGGCSQAASALSLLLEAAKVSSPTTLFPKMQFFHSSEKETERVTTHLETELRHTGE